jgi:hypothetical protein
MTVLKILKDGETDMQSTNISKFVMHTDYPAQKIYSSGQTNLVIPSGEIDGYVTVTHSLGYVPTVFAMFINGDGRYIKVQGLKPVPNRPVDGEPGFYNVVVNSSYIKFEFVPLFSTEEAPSDIGITVYYIILYEEM